jgi:Methyltransferase domain
MIRHLNIYRVITQTLVNWHFTELKMPEKLDQYLIMLENYSKTLAEDASSYWSYHKKRFTWTAALLVGLIHDLRKSGQPVNKILDIGNSFQTILFDSLFQDIQIDTMGFLDSRYTPKRQSIHIPFDLNDSYYKEKWPKLGEEKYDIILMLEVIEHLYTSPKHVLSCLRTIIKDHGFLVIQTPNAVSLSKRYLMLTGNNPYELIRECRDNPGHFREYTRKEICGLGYVSGFDICGIHTKNYFNDKGFLPMIANFLPGSFKNGMTIIFKRRG